MGLLSLIAVATHGVLEHLAAQGLSEGTLIDLAGRQRMLSQRLGVCVLAREHDPRDRPGRQHALLRETQVDFVEGHLAVLGRLRAAGLEGDHSERVASMFERIQPTFDSVTQQVRAIDEGSPPASAGLLVELDSYLSQMDTIVHALSAEWDARVQSHRLILLGLFVALLTAIALVTFVVLEPAVRAVGRSQAELREQYSRADSRRLEAESVNRALQESVRFNEAILDTAADGIVVIDRTGKVMLANPSAHRMFGVDPGTLEGTDITTLMDDYDRTHHAEYVSKYETTGRSSVIGGTREVVGLRRNGERFPVDLSVAVMEWDGKRAYTGFLRDVSERQRMQNRLSQAEKLESLGRLAAGLAHEINTPLQFISANTQFLEEMTPELETALAVGGLLQPNDHTAKMLGQLRSAIHDNLEGVGRVGEILAAMKEFSHPGERERRVTSLNDCVRSTTTISRNRWKHAAEVDLQLETDLPTFRGYPAEINQALLNLVVNAADAILESRGPEGGRLGRITLRTWSDEQSVSVAVEDDGTGIPEDVLPQVFEQFFTTKQVGEGTGQGLSLAHSVATEMHGGTLVAENLPERGARFVMTIPLEPTEKRLLEISGGERCPLADRAEPSTV